jgi:hypothetical protein
MQYYTYEGLIQGKATERLNKAIINNLRVPEGWANRPFHVKLCNESEITTQLPEIVNFVWLESEPLNDQNHGSDLIFAWLSEQQQTVSLIESITQGVGDLDWKSKAKDYLL